MFIKFSPLIVNTSENQAEFDLTSYLYHNDNANTPLKDGNDIYGCGGNVCSKTARLTVPAGVGNRWPEVWLFIPYSHLGIEKNISRDLQALSVLWMVQPNGNKIIMDTSDPIKFTYTQN